MTGRISERVMLFGFLGRRAISLVFQLVGMCREVHITWSEVCRDCSMIVGVACNMLRVRPEGPGDLVPLRLLIDEWNSLKGIC